MVKSIDVSVIITTFNVERYARRAIESALAQSDVALEVIVVDDASTDGTWRVVSGFTDSRLKCLRLEKNGGPGAARNAGMALAGGAWLAVLDGDDVFLAGRLARCLTRAKDTAADIVADNLTVMREADGKSFPMFPAAQLTGELDLAPFIDGNRLFARGYSLGYLKPLFSAAFLRRHQVTYDPGLRIGEDYALFAAALACGARCVTLSEEGYAYTVRGGSISHRLSLDDIDRMITADEKFLLRYPLDPKAAEAQYRRTRSLIKARAFTLMVTALKEKNLSAALVLAARDPAAALELWRPVWVRLRRVFS